MSQLPGTLSNKDRCHNPRVVVTMARSGMSFLPKTGPEAPQDGNLGFGGSLCACSNGAKPQPNSSSTTKAAPQRPSLKPCGPPVPEQPTLSRLQDPTVRALPNAIPPFPQTGYHALALLYEVSSARKGSDMH